MDGKKCQICCKEGRFSCVNCKSANYCSKEHQKADWKVHKKICQTYAVKNDPYFGRYLVSSRNLNQGDRIFSCKPLASGPPLHCPIKTCLFCEKQLANKHQLCNECGFGFCSSQCLREGKSKHSEECSKLSEIKKNSSSKGLNYNLILPLRILLLQNTNADAFDKILSLESHKNECKLSNRWPEVEREVLRPLEAIWDTELISTVCGVIATNAFELSVNGQVGTIVGVFDLPSMMNHDCIGNVRLVISKDQTVTAYASVPISKDKSICFNYVKSLDTTSERQKNLQAFKFFTCQCSRCQDPTELGTFISALLCQDCRGPCVQLDDAWSCSCCNVVLDNDCVQRALGVLDTYKMKFQTCSKGEAELRQIIEELSKVLYKTHGFICEVTMALVRVADVRDVGSLQDKVDTCNRLLSVLDTVEPGLSVSRGVVLYEYQSALVQLSNQEFEKDHSKTRELLEKLRIASDLLFQSRKCLELESPGSLIQGQIQMMLEEHDELENYITMVEQIS